MSDGDHTLMSYEEASPYYDGIYEVMKDYAAEAERLRICLNTTRTARSAICSTWRAEPAFTTST